MSIQNSKTSLDIHLSLSLSLSRLASGRLESVVEHHVDPGESVMHHLLKNSPTTTTMIVQYIGLQGSILHLFFLFLNSILLNFTSFFTVDVVLRWFYIQMCL